jgi:hypothetical protein
VSDEKQAGFEIDGTFHEMPLVGSFDMDENRIFKQRTGLHAEDVWLGLQPGGGMTFGELMRNDGFLESLAHIAYRRSNPGVADDVIAQRIGKVNRIGLFASLVDSMVGTDEDSDPKESGSTRAPNEPSTSSTVDKPNTTGRKGKSSGKGSKKSSGRQDDGPATTGTTGSDTSATSVPLRRVI